jgi:hypothetical protein
LKDYIIYKIIHHIIYPFWPIPDFPGVIPRSMTNLSVIGNRVTNIRKLKPYLMAFLMKEELLLSLMSFETDYKEVSSIYDQVLYRLIAQ